MPNAGLEGAEEVTEPPPNLHRLPLETLVHILSSVSPWDQLSVALTAKSLLAPALSLLWKDIQIFGPSAKADLLLKSESTAIHYDEFVRSIVSGWFALDNEVLAPLLARVGPHLQKLDLWRLRIRPEHVSQNLDFALSDCLGDKLTTLDISDWSTQGTTSSNDQEMYLALQRRPGEFLLNVAKRCPNLKRLYCQETDISPDVLAEALESLPLLDELWFGHFNWGLSRTTPVNTEARYSVVTQTQMDRLAQAVEKSLVELGLFQMSSKSCRFLAPFLDRCRNLKRLVAKRCDAREIFTDIASGLGNRALSLIPTITSLRLKLAAKTELDPLLNILPGLSCLDFLHLTLYLDFRDPESEQNLIRRLTDGLSAVQLDSLKTLRLAIEVSFSTVLQPLGRDLLMSELFGQIDLSFPNLEHLDFKYCGFLDSHSRHISWGPLMVDRLTSVADAKVKRNRPLRRISMSGYHLESISDLKNMLAPFGGKLQTLVLRNVNSTVFQSLKELYGYDEFESKCSSEEITDGEKPMPPLQEREALTWRSWTGQVDFWVNSGWGLYDGVLGGGAAALPQGVGVGGAIFEGDLEDDEGTFETCFVWLGTVKALARLQE